MSVQNKDYKQELCCQKTVKLTGYHAWILL